MFDIAMGVPEMKEFWGNLKKRVKDPALNTHEITELSKRYWERVWQSYLENNTPAVGRIFG